MKLLKNRTLRYIVLFLFGFFYINFFILPDLFPTTNNHESTTKSDNIQPSPWTNEMESFCFKVQQRIKEESRDEAEILLFEDDIQLKSPNFDNDTREQLTEIRYLYSIWRSSSDLPRRFSSCDHSIFTELLRIIDHFFRRHRITYMMMGGTLLGKKLGFYSLNSIRKQRGVIFVYFQVAIHIMIFYHGTMMLIYVYQFVIDSLCIFFFIKNLKMLLI